MLEMYEGKATIDITKIDDLTRQYLVEFKDKLNDHIDKIRKTNKKKPQPTNSREYHTKLANSN